jgi:hypothetical protein
LFCTLQGVAQYRPSDYTSHPEPLDDFNDGFQNLNPYISSAGDQMWVTKISHPENTGAARSHDVWESRRVNGNWSKPTNDSKSLNTELNDLIIGQSHGELIYVLRYQEGFNDPESKIVCYQQKGGEYVVDHEIQMPKISFQSEFFGFFIPADESYILLSMKGEFSFGKEDLYVVQKIKGKWGDPIHLGARINTSGFEMSPYMADDGKHLYFASEGHGSYGNADIFVSVRLDDTWASWSKPINLGPNINSEGFEAYFTLNLLEDEAYFVSNRQNNSGGLFKIDYSPSTGELLTAHPSASGFIRMEKLPALNVRLNLLDENDRVIQTVTTNDEGYFNLQSFLPDRDYKIAIEDSVRQDLSTADIFLTNDLGEKMVFMNQEELGLFGFKVLSGKKINEINELEGLAGAGSIVDRSTTISGKVATFGTLKEKVKLNIVDENSKVIDEIETDEDGYFEFKTNALEKSYFLSVDEEKQGLVDVYEIFLTNDNAGEDIVVSKTNKHLFEFRALSGGRSNRGISKVVEHDRDLSQVIFDKYGYLPTRTSSAMSGYLKLDKLPLINTTISLIDNEDNTVEKAITDAEGRFVFEDAIPEGDYTLQLDEKQQLELGASEIYLAKNPQDVVFYLNDDRAGVFAFKKLSQERPMTLYSLRTETENGFVVSGENARIRGKFEYKKLPKSGVKLKLLDEKENVIQITEVKENGEFEFENYTVNENYFISVEDAEGLSDIYEIYLSGQQRNVLVNRTNRFVFAFTVLPSQDILLTKSYENDAIFGQVETPVSATQSTKDKRYFEFDLNELSRANYSAFEDVKVAARSGNQITIRISKEDRDSNELELRLISDAELLRVRDQMVVRGIDASQISTARNGSDQVIYTIN